MSASAAPLAYLYIVSHGKMRRPAANIRHIGQNVGQIMEGGIRLELSEYFGRIFPSTAGQMYYPNRKNSGIFVSFCFIEAGSNYFSHKPSDRLKSDDVPLERKLYDGARKMSQDLKDSFMSFNADGLCAYFEKIINKDKYGDIMLAFAIPPTEEKKSAGTPESTCGSVQRIY